MKVTLNAINRNPLPRCDPLWLFLLYLIISVSNEICADNKNNVLIIYCLVVLFYTHKDLGHDFNRPNSDENAIPPCMDAFHIFLIPQVMTTKRVQFKMKTQKYDLIYNYDLNVGYK